MTKQKATGNIVIDSISTLDMTMKSGSYYEGTINGYTLYIDGEAIN